MMRTKCSGQAGHNPAKPAGSAKKIVLVDMPTAPRVRVVETTTAFYVNRTAAWTSIQEPRN